VKILRNPMTIRIRRYLVPTVFLFLGFVTLSGFNREGGPSDIDCQECHDEMSKALDERYVHYPFEMKQCDACHDAEKFTLTEQVPDLCTVCHRDFQSEKGKELHSAAEDCTNCHNPHASKYQYMLVESVPNLCLQCHEPLPSGETPKSVHAPVEAGECDSCHNPHASANKPLLRQQPSELCGGCHDLADPDFAKAHLNLLKKDSSCLSCHRGHYSSNESLILENAHYPFAEKMCDSCHDSSAPGKFTASGSQLCLNCHADIETLVQSKFPHIAASEDCLGCHGPHATSKKSLLLETGEKLCGQCHDLTHEENAVLHPPFADGECTECHNPHGSANEGILNGAQSELCLNCHTDIREQIEERHPHTAVTQGCVACHEPHQGRLKSLLKEEGEALCFRCHDSRQKQTARFVHYPYREGVCLTCHLPHSGVGVGDLTKGVEELCTTCHQKKHKDFPHPVGIKPSPDFVLQPENKLNFKANDVITCTTCHFPHTSDTVFLLRVGVTGGDLCYQCHQR
jgi:predicted CXXCH cytochrome family protein